MKISPRRSRRPSALIAILTAGAFIVPAAADAEAGQYDWAPSPDPGSGVPYQIVGGELPDQLFEEVSSCPAVESFESVIVPYCVKVKVRDGEIKLGKTTAQVDPFEIIMGLGTQEDGQLVMVPGGSEGSAPAAVPIGGGLLGIPALDALIEPLGLLSISATPMVGEPALVGQPGQSPLATGLDFSRWVGGTHAGPVTFNVPMSIKLNNLLLGETCEIGQIDLNLTTGPAAPPPDVEPLSGANGNAWSTTWFRDGYPPANPFDPGPSFNINIHDGATFVDNGFTVPGASDCGVAGLGKILSDLDLRDLNVFNRVINSQSGLPSVGGRNYARFTVDVLMMSYNSSSGLGSPWYLGDPRLNG